MTSNKFSSLNFGNNLVINKPKYREDEYRSKNTYNFVTDPRLKRGRNYGIVYVTSTAFEENEIAMKKLNDQQIRRRKKNDVTDLSKMGVPLPEGMENACEQTSEITDEILPKPETYEMEVQTQDYIDRPQTPLFFPRKDGEDKGTQIELGELFDFDEEIEPVINVLTFKILEEARMEVLEEDELKEMKEQQEYFDRVRNRELEEVQKLENEEKRRIEERTRRNIEREMRIKMGVIYQQKLISCVFAKKYLSKLKETSLTALESIGVLKKPVVNQYHTSLLPTLKEGAEAILEDESIVLNEVDSVFEELYTIKQQEKHKESIVNEKKRIEEIEYQRQEDLRRKEEEKLRRRAERKRKQHEKELEELKRVIVEELIVNGQFTDEVNDIYNINGYHKKGVKSIQATGGHLGQVVINILLFRKYIPAEAFDDELIEKIIDLYLIKSPAITLLYRNEELEKLKEKDPNLTAYEDIFKLEDVVYSEMIEEIIDNSIKNDEILPIVFESVNEVLKNEESMGLLKKIMAMMFKVSKATTDFVNKDKIKFIPCEDPIDFNYTAICLLNPANISKPKPPIDITQHLLMKKATKRGDKPQRPNFEPFYSAKSFIVPLSSDKMKIIGINAHFDKIFRQNFLECMTKIEKLEFDKAIALPEVEEVYNAIIDNLTHKLMERYSKEKVDIEIEDPSIVNENPPLVNPEQIEAQPEAQAQV